LMYGEREEILVEAKSRLAALQKRYPNARLYGETEAGGLGVIMVLPDEPGAFDLPTNPQIPLTVTAWQKAVQPLSLAMTGLSIAVTGVAAVIARRNHVQEVKRLHALHETREGEKRDKEIRAEAEREPFGREAAAVDSEPVKREERAA
ncbi:MAG: hypothetical protein KDE47_02230, partial [Caldilineaceae bacterium]|nr:hypothetical protein [Caldilineaceae bacterium]